jgi:hypothetical protein
MGQKGATLSCNRSFYFGWSFQSFSFSKILRWFNQNGSFHTHTHMCLFMSMLYNKIRFEIDINNNELLKTICEHMKEVKKGERAKENIIKLINLHLHYLYSYLFLTFSKWKFKDFYKLLEYIPQIENFSPDHGVLVHVRETLQMKEKIHCWR